MNNTAQRTASLFRDRYTGEPNLYFSPGRINLIGEHIDYNDGFVLPAAIDKGIYFAVASNGSETVNFYSVDFKEQYSSCIHAIHKNSGWRNYLLGVLREFQSAGKAIGGFDCVFTGDIPIGSGMSSSAAAEGGLAFALNDIFNCGFSRKDLARLCQRAEHGFPGVQCGIMDQFANMMGKKNSVMLLDCLNLSHQYIPWPGDEYAVVLVNSMVKHSLASGEYNVRREQCEEGMAFLHVAKDISSFRDIKDIAVLDMVRDKVSNTSYNRCRYVVEEIRRTKKAAELLQNNDLAGFGRLMFESHAGLRDLYEVSCPELDFLVDKAKSYPFVAGARMMGGGFGGCTINLLKKENMEEFSQLIQAAYAENMNIQAELYSVGISGGVDLMTND